MDAEQPRMSLRPEEEAVQRIRVVEKWDVLMHLNVGVTRKRAQLAVELAGLPYLLSLAIVAL